VTGIPWLNSSSSAIFARLHNVTQLIVVQFLQHFDFVPEIYGAYEENVYPPLVRTVDRGR
jgi:hypothetical protein